MPPQKVRVRIRTTGRVAAVRHRLRRLARRARPHLVVATVAVIGAVVIWVVLGRLGGPPPVPE